LRDQRDEVLERAIEAVRNRRDQPNTLIAPVRVS
jgi:hypothetical protein